MDSTKPHVLICPLEWGLGHFTRCIPIIKIFEIRGYKISVAGTKQYQNLLNRYFSSLEYIYLPSFTIKRYSRCLFLGLILKLPVFLYETIRENVQLKRILKYNNIDIVISDNRYGLWNRKKYCILITHQLNIQLPRVIKIFSHIIWSITRVAISKFDECWVPDFEEKSISVSGNLSHSSKISSNIRYIGLLSRFANNSSMRDDLKNYDFKLLVILSGPEPFRGILENIIIREAERIKISTLILRGIPENQNVPGESKLVKYINFPEDDAFQFLVTRAQFIVCRSGYSTLMDIITLGRKAILVPTPGQTEQLYLSKWLNNSESFVMMTQKEFDLDYGLTLLKNKSEAKFTFGRNNSSGLISAINTINTIAISTQKH